MSATTPRIEARPGHTYLTVGGRRWRVTAVSANRVEYRDLAEPAYPVVSTRAEFEAWVESVIE